MQMLKLFPAAHQEKITCVAFDPAHNQIFVAAQSPNIIVWNTKSNSSQPVAVMKGHKGAVTGLVYFSGMGLVISSSLDGTLVVWDDRFKVLQVGSCSIADLLSCVVERWRATQDPNTGAKCKETNPLYGLEPKADNHWHWSNASNAVLQDDRCAATGCIQTHQAERNKHRW